MRASIVAASWHEAMTEYIGIIWISSPARI